MMRLSFILAGLAPVAALAAGIGSVAGQCCCCRPAAGAPAKPDAPGGAPSCHAAGPVAGVAPLAAAPADDKPAGKDVKVTGTLVCGKCNLKETAKCSNVLQVKEGDKVANYYLTDKGNGETYHEGVCGGDKVENVTVAGKLTEKDGKKWVTPTKVELPKK